MSCYAIKNGVTPLLLGPDGRVVSFSMDGVTYHVEEETDSPVARAVNVVHKRREEALKRLGHPRLAPPPPVVDADGTAGQNVRIFVDGLRTRPVL